MMKKAIPHIIYAAIILTLLIFWRVKHQTWKALDQHKEIAINIKTAEADSLLAATYEKDRRIAEREQLLGLLNLLRNGNPSEAKSILDKMAENEDFSPEMLAQARHIHNDFQQNQLAIKNFHSKILLLDRTLAEKRTELENRERELEAAAEVAKAQMENADNHYDSLSAEYALLMDTLMAVRQELQAARDAIPEALIFKNSKKLEIVYLGHLENNKANGKGIGFWETGSIYRGDWKNNQRHGWGIFTWKDGERYEGSYVEDRREGKGSYFWANGERYEGDWKNDKREGSGIIFDKKGKVKVHGIWEADKLLREFAVEN